MKWLPQDMAERAVAVAQEALLKAMKEGWIRLDKAPNPSPSFKCRSAVTQRRTPNDRQRTETKTRDLPR